MRKSVAAAVSAAFFCSVGPPIPAQGTTWTRFADREKHAMAAGAQGKLVLFGGLDTRSKEPRGDTFVLESRGWTQRFTSEHPGARSGHAMATGVDKTDATFAVLFGGRKRGVPDNQTWRMDGNNWTQGRPSGQIPPAREGHAMVWDSNRKKIVLFGGIDENNRFFRDTWEYDPEKNEWKPITNLAKKPPERSGHAMVFDPNKGVVVLFGGSANNETWVYDSRVPSWTPFKVPGPSGRIGTAMAYDAHPLRRHIVLFGGDDGNGTLDDTWVWDGSSWTSKTPSSKPPARSEHAMAYDRAGTTPGVILLGGRGGQNAELRGTWLWNGTTWTERFPPPSPRNGVQLAFDPNGKGLLFGGRDKQTGNVLGDTWVLEGTTWRKVPSSSNDPTPRADYGLVFHDKLDVFVMYGGQTGGGGGKCGTPVDNQTTWRWDPRSESWSPHSTVTHYPPPGTAYRALAYMPDPDGKTGHAVMIGENTVWSYNGSDWSRKPFISGRTTEMVFDEGRGCIVLFGGTSSLASGKDAFNDTWEWSGNGPWRHVSPPYNQRPPARAVHGMAYDKKRKLTIVHGGGPPNSTILRDTWGWNGSSWQLLTTGGPQVQEHRLAYDSNREVTVLFGGDSGGRQNWTYELDYSTATSKWSWKKITPKTTTPPVRNAHAMAFDARRGVTVLFGGYTGTDRLPNNDTWLWDGSDWTQKNPTKKPDIRAGARMTFFKDRVILYGGEKGGQSTVYKDTWAWDGTSWTDLDSSAPMLRFGVGMAATKNQLLVFGGSGLLAARKDVGTMWSDTWRWNESKTQWDPLAPDHGPRARIGYGTVWDPTRKAIVMYGGRTGCTPSGSGHSFRQTWLWDGDAWDRGPPTTITKRWGSPLAFDAVRGLSLFFGGHDIANSKTLSDTLEWDGTNWAEQRPKRSPPAMREHGLAYDPARRVAVAFGTAGTWEYALDDPPGVRRFGGRCSEPMGHPPAFDIKTPAGSWLGGKIILTVTPVIASVLFLAATEQKPPLPLGFGTPECKLHAGLVPFFLPLNMPGGVFELPIPNDRSWIGVSLFVQSFWLQASPFRFGLTEGAQLTI